MSKSTQIWNWFPFPRIEVFTKRKKVKKFYKELTGKKFKFMEKAAEVHYLENKGNESLAIIYFDPKILKSVSLSQRIGIVAHECSHIVDNIEAWMGEDKLATETRAYFLDTAVMAVCEQLGDKWFKTRQV